MTLQNRAAPDGTLHCNRARGMFTGNRGILHDPDTKTLTGRRWTTKAWIACTCDWRGRRRDVWGCNGPNGGAGWTELFFLDEVTALAAGHRPCFYCRRARATAFARAFAKGHRLSAARAPAMDAMLHDERRLSRRLPPVALGDDELAGLPDGTMIEADRAGPGGTFLAVRAGKALVWDFSGYGPAINLGEVAPGPVRLVTPPAIVAALGSGYAPAWHASATHPAAA